MKTLPFIILAAILCYMILATIAYQSTPRLVGYGCQGAGGTLWANEEDDFPAPCEDIHAI